MCRQVERNSWLRDLDLWPSGDVPQDSRFAAVLERNKRLPDIWATVAWVVRGDSDRGQSSANCNTPDVLIVFTQDQRSDAVGAQGSFQG